MPKEFKSIDEIISNIKFIQLVEKNYRELRKQRENRKPAPAGMHYKRDWYDRMTDAGHLNYDFFLKNIKSIWEKKSELPSETRKIIKFICDLALYQTIAHYNKDKLPK